MDSNHTDINYFLGSWGTEREDEAQPLREVPASDLLTKDDWYELAVRWFGFALEDIRAGRADDAAFRASCVVRYCRRYQGWEER